MVEKTGATPPSAPSFVADNDILFHHKTTGTMKKTVSLLALASIVWLFTACQPAAEDQPQPENAISEEEAAELVETAVSETSQGMSSEAENAAMMAAGTTNANGQTTMNCGETRDTTLSYNRNLPNGYVTYTNDIQWTLQCNQLHVPTSMQYVGDATAEFETYRALGNFNALTAFDLSGLAPAQPEYTLNGLYTFEGTVEGKGLGLGSDQLQGTYTLTLEITVENLTFDKDAFLITGGTATFTMTVSVDGNVPVTFEGTIEFLGNGDATVIINGQQYDIDL